MVTPFSQRLEEEVEGHLPVLDRTSVDTQVMCSLGQVEM